MLSFFGVVAVLCLFDYSVAQNVTTSSVKQAFADAKLVPDVLSSFDPTAILNVVLDDSATKNRTLDISPGQNLTVERECIIVSQSVD
jgi:hypothetical protein